MQQLARLKFTSFGLVVPPNWQQPQGDPAAQHYNDAFKDSEKASAPGFPALFQPASMNKFHTDTQKMLISSFGGFIDDICSAICSAWGEWQSTATMVGVLINAVTASAGQLVGPPLTPLIMASAPKTSPQALKFSNVIATVIGNSWLLFTATVKIPGLPLYPAYAAVPSPVAPPTPNVPVPFATLTQVPVSISCNTMKPQMIGMLGDPLAPYSKELFESICDAFEKTYDIWKLTTMVTNVMPTLAPVPTFAPPYVPVGPVVGGVAAMLPGGLT